MEGKVVAFKMEGSKLVLQIDSNKDGQPLMTLTLELSEVADELFSLLKGAKKE